MYSSHQPYAQSYDTDLQWMRSLTFEDTTTFVQTDSYSFFFFFLRNQIIQLIVLSTFRRRRAPACMSTYSINLVSHISHPWESAPLQLDNLDSRKLTLPWVTALLEFISLLLFSHCLKIYCQLLWSNQFLPFLSSFPCVVYGKIKWLSLVPMIDFSTFYIPVLSVIPIRSTLYSSEHNSHARSEPPITFKCCPDLEHLSLSSLHRAFCLLNPSPGISWKETIPGD